MQKEMKTTLLGYTRDSRGKVVSYHPITLSNTITPSSAGGGDTSMFVLVREWKSSRFTFPRQRGKDMPNAR